MQVIFSFKLPSIIIEERKGAEGYSSAADANEPFPFEGPPGFCWRGNWAVEKTRRKEDR